MITHVDSTSCNDHTRKIKSTYITWVYCTLGKMNGSLLYSLSQFDRGSCKEKKKDAMTTVMYWDLQSASQHAGRYLQPASQHAGRYLQPASQHAGRYLQPASQHAGRYLQPASQHAGRYLQPASQHAGRYLQPASQHAGFTFQYENSLDLQLLLYS